METTYYDDAAICVTNKRLIVAGRSLPIEEVDSVQQMIDEPRKIGAALGIFGCALLAAWVALGQDSPALAFLMVFVAMLAAVGMAARRSSYTVSVVRADGSTPIFISQDEQFAKAVIKAIDAAISSCRR